jgi:hypothetical protein
MAGLCKNYKQEKLEAYLVPEPKAIFVHHHHVHTDAFMVLYDHIWLCFQDFVYC